MKLPLLTLLILCCLTISGFSQLDPCHKTTEGQDFWFGFMENRWSFEPNPPPYVEVTVTSRVDADFTIAIGPSETPYGPPYHVNANSSTPVTIDWDIASAIGSQNTENKAIHIVSTQPVNVYAYNYCSNSSDVADIYPTSSLGTEYYTMCYNAHYIAPNGGNPIGNGRNSEFLIVAAYDNTTVEITPSVDMDQKLSSAKKTFSITLNKGQLYQVQSNNMVVGPRGDLTGSYIKSNHPIALYAGSLATTIPDNVTAWDHLYEQMPPVQSWGREYYICPLKGRLQDRYRILACKDNTIVNIENIGDRFLNKGEIFEFPLNYNQPSHVMATQPILVAQYSQSNDADRPAGLTQNQWDGDPFMIILSPVEQTVNDVTFVAYQSSIINKTYVNVISRTDLIGTLLMDESPAFQSSFQPFKNGLYSFAQIQVPKGSTHRIRNTDSKAGFLATVYGFGGVEAFGYGVGFNLDIHVELGSDTIINNRKTRIRCFGADSLTLNAGSFDKYLWSTKDTVSSIKVIGPGTYSVTASIGECIVSDTVNVVVNQPVLTLGTDRVVCNPDTIRLDAGFGWKAISWTPTNENSQIISPKTSGTYSVQVTNRNGCSAAGSINLTFDDRPKLNILNLDTLYCGAKSAILGISASKGTYTLERTDTGEKFQNLTATVPVFGSYPFKFTATDPEGCFKDITFKLGFHKIPIVNFSIDSTKCYHYNLDVSYTGDAEKDLARFTWVFGGDTIANGISIESYTIPLGDNQNKRDLTLKVLQEGCSNADTIKDIKVIPDLTLQIVDTLGCQPFNAEFIAKNSEIVKYDWNFGDGTSQRLDNHPFHNYQNEGYYNVKLKVTTDEGCTNEASKDSMLYVAPIPTVGFSLDPLKCLDLGNHNISYVGTGDTMDSYQWDLSGFDPQEIIRNPNNTQGPFIFNLKNKPLAPVSLSVLSKYGCKSVTKTIDVKRTPAFTMSVADNKGCVPFEPGFTAIPTELVDQVAYTWDFGDATSGTGANASHLYTDANKKYNITLTGLSSVTQCSEIIKMDTLIFAYPKPLAAFSLDHSIVYNDKPDVKFENLSTGAVNYLWDFGDGSTSTEVNVSHKYQVMGYQKVLLQSFNEFTCSDTISHTVLVGTAHIYPPNAFSPNAPSPVDREFRLSQETIKEDGYHLTILSRWNDIVFETKNEIKGWNGRMKSGDNAPAGNYVWTLDFFDFLGRPHRQTGTVTLVY